MENLYKHVGEVNTLLERYGVRFGIYKNGTFYDSTVSTDNAVTAATATTNNCTRCRAFVLRNSAALVACASKLAPTRWHEFWYFE